MKINYALKLIKKASEREGKQSCMLSYLTIYNLIKNPYPNDGHKKEQLFSLSLIAITKSIEKPQQAESMFYDNLRQSSQYLIKKAVKNTSLSLDDFDLKTDEKIESEILNNAFYLFNYKKFNHHTYNAFLNVRKVLRYNNEFEAYNQLVEIVQNKIKEAKHSNNAKYKMILIILLYSKEPLKAFIKLEKYIVNQHFGFISDYVDYKISQIWYRHVKAKDFFDFSKKMRNNNQAKDKLLNEVKYRESEIKRLNKLLWKI